MWKYHRNKPVISPEDFGAMVAVSGSPLRLGAYGEPVAIPMEFWKPAINATIENKMGFTGYSHQWSNPQFQMWSEFLMASIHSTSEIRKASKLGWRYFRSSTDGHVDWDVRCPEPDKGVHCIAVQFCKGMTNTG